MNIRAAIVIGVFAAAVTLAVCARADSPGYGFTDPAYDYSREYRDCAWPDDGSGRRYVPGYREDRERSRCATPGVPNAAGVSAGNAAGRRGEEESGCNGSTNPPNRHSRH